MIKRLFLILAALVFLPAQALANDLEGTWALRIGEANIFTFEITQTDDGEWQGRWQRPEDFASNGVVFAQMTGSVELDAMAANEFAEVVELSFDDPRPGAVPDIFRFRQLSDNQAEMTYVGTGFDPYPLIRVARGAELGPFDPDLIYDRDNAVTEAEYVEPVEEVEIEVDETVVDEEPVEEAAAPDAEAETGNAEEEPEGLPADFLDEIEP